MKITLDKLKAAIDEGRDHQKVCGFYDAKMLTTIRVVLEYLFVYNPAPMAIVTDADKSDENPSGVNLERFRILIDRVNKHKQCDHKWRRDAEVLDQWTRDNAERLLRLAERGQRAEKGDLTEDEIKGLLAFAERVQKQQTEKAKQEATDD